MATAGEEFLARPDVRVALDELFEGCFATIRAGGDGGDLPDVREFLQGRGIEAPHDLELKHGVDDEIELDDKAQPMAPICDEKGTRAYTQCERIKGRLHCHWVCP